MAEVISWGWRQQPDLAALGEAVRRVSGGSCDIVAVETAGDEYAIVVADHTLSEDEARELFLGGRDYDEEGEEWMRAYWADRDAEVAGG